MKKLSLYSLLACVCLMMQSCLFSEDDTFDQSSAQRASSSVEECKQALQSATNGWLMEYYPGDGLEFGGYNMLVKFDGDKVQMASEQATTNHEAGEVVTSDYKVDSHLGTELSFDSYNELIHAFCEPNGYDDPGYSGDYEFYFKDVTPEKIELTGKKHGNKLVLTRLADDTNWSEYINGITALEDDSPYLTYKLKVDGNEVGTILRSNHVLELKKNGEDKTQNIPFIYTPKGLRLASPVTIEGKQLSDFTWNAETRTFASADEGVNADIEFYCPDNYGTYLGTYYLYAGTKTYAVKISQGVEGATYNINFVSPASIANLNIEADYNFDTDCFDIESQYVGDYMGYNIYLCPWSAASGYLTWQNGTGLSGYVTSDDGAPLTIEFKDNGVWGEADSFLLYAFDGAPSSSTVAGYILQGKTPKLVKVN